MFGHAGVEEKNVLELVRRTNVPTTEEEAQRSEGREPNSTNLRSYTKKLRKNMNHLDSDLKRSFPDGPSSAGLNFRRK